MAEPSRELAINFGPILEANIGQLRKLNRAILPVRYSDRFYTDVLAHGRDWCKNALCNGFVVGAICSRVEDAAPAPAGEAEDGAGADADPSSSLRRVYIMTLCVLPAYRQRGVGRRLLESVLEKCVEQEDIGSIYLHVQTTNQDAIDFYSRFGFEVCERVENYYKRIDPPDCFILRKTFER
mmetsp:Transcript_26278/g.52400  ORF Transcript_26278/g.52400 Transcript_26278/m.52400 type:complete len:181 (+) Transcript_26278:3-545(+)